MRPVLIFLFALIFASCNLVNNTSDKNLPLTKKALYGNWIIIKLDAKSNNEKYESMMKSATNALKDNIELGIFDFQKEDQLLIDEGKIEKIKAKWALNSDKQIYLQHKDLAASNPEFTITLYRNDSLLLENILKNKSNEELHIRLLFKKLKVADTIPDIFSPELNKWRERPLRAESDAEIKTRLKQVLYYYSAYFATLSSNQIPFFNINKIACPILFYSGGIGLKKFHISDEWTKMFFDNRDAEKAHHQLDKAFSYINNYPDKGGDYVAEYIIALKMVADEL